MLPSLGYGQSWEQGCFKCKSEQSGVTCANPSGHGFELSKSSQRAFQASHLARGRRATKEREDLAALHSMTLGALLRSLPDKFKCFTRRRRWIGEPEFVLRKRRDNSLLFGSSD